MSPITIDTAGISAPEIMAPKNPITMKNFSRQVMYLKNVLIATVYALAPFLFWAVLALD